MIETGRLSLRPWREDDVPALHAIGQDPEVMRYLPGLLSLADAEAFVAGEMTHQQRHGHAFWALEHGGDGAVIGFCGLRVGGHPGTDVPDELEIGWRLARAYWHRGLAREAAGAAIDWGWRNTARDRIAAWTVPANAPSWGLMRRLGMTPRPDLDFDHPFFADPSHPLSRHLVHVIERPGRG